MGAVRALPGVPPGEKVVLSQVSIVSIHHCFDRRPEIRNTQIPQFDVSLRRSEGSHEHLSENAPALFKWTVWSRCGVKLNDPKCLRAKEALPT